MKKKTEHLQKKNLEKARNIEKKLQKISELMELRGENIIIELIGTPKSGKTTLANHLKTCFEKNGIPFILRKETAEYNPIQKDIEGYNDWMTLELFKNVAEDVCDNKEKQKPKVILYDRGILDRMNWIDCDKSNDFRKMKSVEALKSLYNLKFLSKYRPISIGFLTSPTISIKRKGKPGQIVNEDFLHTYNRVFINNQIKIKAKSATYSLINTDEYEGDIKRFILDGTNAIVNGVLIELNRRQNVQED